jgi:hypothetical protein
VAALVIAEATPAARSAVAAAFMAADAGKSAHVTKERLAESAQPFFFCAKPARLPYYAGDSRAWLCDSLTAFLS